MHESIDLLDESKKVRFLADGEKSIMKTCIPSFSGYTTLFIASMSGSSGSSGYPYVNTTKINCKTDDLQVIS